MDEIDVTKARTQFFFEKKVKVHVIFKDDSWKNGFVKEISADFFLLDESVEGEQPIFFIQVKEISPYINRGEDARQYSYQP